MTSTTSAAAITTHWNGWSGFSAIADICVTARAAASSRLMAYNKAVRRSRAPATRFCWRTLAIRVAMPKPMMSMTAKVTAYSTSLNANVKRGGTKKKSNAATLSMAAATDGPRPSHNPVAATPNR